MTPADEMAQLKADHAELQARYVQAQEQIAALLARVQDLEARLAKDRHNRGKPPASDELRRKPESLRKQSGRKPGGQLGHRGETLHLVATPDLVLEHRPAVCAHGQTPLDGAPVLGRERRQLHELPPVRLVVSEHQALHVRCPACDAVGVGAFPPETPSRAQYGPQLRALAIYLVEEQLVPLGRVRATAARPVRRATGARHVGALDPAGGHGAGAGRARPQNRPPARARAALRRDGGTTRRAVRLDAYGEYGHTHA
jgi:hypothetical protein